MAGLEVAEPLVSQGLLPSELAQLLNRKGSLDPMETPYMAWLLGGGCGGKVMTAISWGIDWLDGCL